MYIIHTGLALTDCILVSSDTLQKELSGFISLKNSDRKVALMNLADIDMLPGLFAQRCRRPSTGL
jgi:hypothetical protein